MKILAVNGSPRKDKNTGSLLQQIVEGALSRGASGEVVGLYSLNYKGCISCFQCKLPDGAHYGRCAVRDDLTPILNRAHEADVLVLGSPLYFSTESGMMRCFMERLWFQYNLYSTKKTPLSPRKKATALVYTMNIRKEDIDQFGNHTSLRVAKLVMERLFAPCELFLCTDTKQFDDYSPYEVDVIDIEHKIRRHEEVFPKELQAAFDLGARLVS